MSEATDASGVTDAPPATPFTMISGGAGAVVCEGDVCYVPKGEAESAVEQ